MFSQHLPLPLTAREAEVASLVAHGCTNRQIGETLVIAERTAESHVSNICAKLGVRSRIQVAVWAALHGLVDPRSLLTGYDA